MQTDGSESTHASGGGRSHLKKIRMVPRMGTFARVINVR